MGHDVYQETYQLISDIERSIQIKLVPKLTDAALNTNNFHKMNVSLAARVFSNYMAMAIKTHRERNAVTEEEARHCKHVSTLLHISVLVTMYQYLKSKAKGNDLAAKE